MLECRTAISLDFHSRNIYSATEQTACWKETKISAMNELSLRGICDGIMSLTNLSKPITVPPGFVGMTAPWGCCNPSLWADGQAAGLSLHRVFSAPSALCCALRPASWCRNHHKGQEQHQLGWLCTYICVLSDVIIQYQIIIEGWPWMPLRMEHPQPLWSGLSLETDWHPYSCKELTLPQLS